MFRLAFIIAGLVSLVNIAQAQEEPSNVIPLAVVAQCTDEAVAKRMVDNWEEIPLLNAQSRTQALPSGQFLEGKIKMYANPETWSWTIFITDPEEKLWCMLTSGDNLKVGGGDSI